MAKTFIVRQTFEIFGDPCETEHDSMESAEKAQEELAREIAEWQAESNTGLTDEEIADSYSTTGNSNEVEWARENAGITDVDVLYDSIINECVEIVETTEYEYIIADGSCNGEEEQFMAFVEKLHPEWDVEIKTALDTGLFANGDRDEDFSQHDTLWDQYCSQ